MFSNSGTYPQVVILAQACDAWNTGVKRSTNKNEYMFSYSRRNSYDKNTGVKRSTNKHYYMFSYGRHKSYD
jgi:hypothetical protein